MKISFVLVKTGNLIFLRLDFDSTIKYLDLNKILKKKEPMAPEVMWSIWGRSIQYVLKYQRKAAKEVLS